MSSLTATSPMGTSAAAAAGAAVVASGEDEKVLEEQLQLLRQLRDVSRTRKLTRAQAEVVALAFCKYNLLMRGPPNSGKRWIARHAQILLGMKSNKGTKVETVEIMSKWFTVTPQGQVIIDDAMLAVGMEQIHRATVLIIENVPGHPLAAAAFFAHLDFICKVERCKACRAAATSTSTSAYAASAVNNPSELPFGGIQIIATQNDAADAAATPPNNEYPNTPQVLWSTATTNPNPIATNNSASAISARGGSGPGVPVGTTQLGLLVTTAAPATSNPHPDIFVVLFR